MGLNGQAADSEVFASKQALWACPALKGEVCRAFDQINKSIPASLKIWRFRLVTPISSIQVCSVTSTFKDARENGALMDGPG